MEQQENDTINNYTNYDLDYLKTQIDKNFLVLDASISKLKKLSKSTKVNV